MNGEHRARTAARETRHPRLDGVYRPSSGGSERLTPSLHEASRLALLWSAEQNRQAVSGGEQELLHGLGAAVGDLPGMAAQEEVRQRLHEQLAELQTQALAAMTSRTAALVHVEGEVERIAQQLQRIAQEGQAIASESP